MAKFVDIVALADEVLSSVEAPASEKTASEGTALNTDIGNALKEAAASIRDVDDSKVTSDDLHDFIYQVKKAMGMPIPNASAPGGVQQNMPGAEMPNPGGAAPGAPSTGGLPTGAPKLASSDLGLELQKLAEHVRSQGASLEEKKMIKAAQMINAAVGLKHFMEDSK
jgi:hypothetical protein